MKNITLVLIFSLSLVALSCTKKITADLLVYNATIYTVDSSFTIADALVTKDGKILAVGKLPDLQKLYNATNKLDAEGKFIYPGFIDAHTHFVEYALGLQQLDIAGTGSWEEIITKLKVFATVNKEGWIIGRGWDQNHWEVKEFPNNELLNSLFPDRPVMLERIDGHAIIANKKALELAGIKAGDAIAGGVIEIKPSGGTSLPTLTGILIDNAVKLVTQKIPSASINQYKNALQAAQQNCFAMGLTTLDDCGLNFSDVEKIKKLQQDGDLKMRLYIMLSDAKNNYDYLQKKGIIKTNRLNVRSFKVYGDGALGSRGACLLNPYSDKPTQSGFLLSSIAHFDSVAAWISINGFQMCTHAIGDSANRTILQIYAKHLKGKNDLRWRIEHAQVINQNDFALFGANSIIPSVQPTHASSDMNWAVDRLGTERVRGAYAYQQLLQQNGWIPLGTDFPIEDIATFKTFYAAAIRKDARGLPVSGYQMDNVLTREQSLRGMTIWAAKANFEEKEKGSLEQGKLADFVLLDGDLMKMSPDKILTSKVLKTFLNGEKVYEKK